MAAYAALVSLMNLLEQIQHHPQPPITLESLQVESLIEKIAFLQDFLEVYNSHYANPEVERLRNRIANAAYAAEDVIESHIVDQIRAQCREENKYFDLFREYRKQYHPQSTSHGETRHYKVARNIIKSRIHGEKINYDELYGIHMKEAVLDVIKSTNTYREEKMSYVLLCRALQKVIEEMDFVKKEVVEFKYKVGNQGLERIITTRVVSSKSPSTEHNTMVGFDDVLNEMLDKLTGQPHSHRQIIPIISGMGGIGKTTLARNVYINPLIEHHFENSAWITISQEYNIQEILLEALLCQKNQGNRESLSQMSEVELGEKLYKSLCGKRYFIRMDDMWSNDVWDKLKFFFPNNNGSRIVITTRLSNIASHLTETYILSMSFLDQDKSWTLLCKTVFGEEDCPPELEQIGMEIAKSCKGLPLSIVVLGGLLAKSKPTREYWEYILENISSIVNLEENERCLTILHTSYNELPVHLKACFLYMGTFLEDSNICVSELIKMWVAEGFLKPISGKDLEETANDYLKDLIDRNLILIREHGSSGKVKFCNIHEFFRNLSLREAQKEIFFFVANQHSLNTPYESINAQRRIAIYHNTSEGGYLRSLKSALVTRSLICYSQEELPLVERRLLRVFKRVGNNI